MKKWAVLLALVPSPVMAAEERVGCYDIIFGADLPLLLDRCAGSVWALIKDEPDERGVYGYSWQPIPVGKSPLAVSDAATRQEAQKAALAKAERERKQIENSQAYQLRTIERTRLMLALGRTP